MWFSRLLVENYDRLLQPRVFQICPMLVGE
jgi:hypothetical protein